MNRSNYNENINQYNRRHSYVDTYKSKTNGRMNGNYGNTSEISGSNAAYASRHTFESNKSIVIKGDADTSCMKIRVAGLRAKLKDNDYINSKIVALADWLEVDDKQLRVEGVKKKMPAKLVAIIAVVAISLMLVVSGAVISSKALMELYSSQNELLELQSLKVELEHELELKNDLRYIEQVARNELGMIDREHGAVQCIDNELSNKVEIYENNTVYSKLSSLLDSLSFLGEE